MLLTSITANRHIYEGEVNGGPLRLLLNFDDGRSIRLAVAEDGSRMNADDQPLDEPVDLDEMGAVDVADVTQALGRHLRGADVQAIRALASRGSRVGVALVLATGATFFIWVDDDELYWGDEAVFSGHEWLGGVIPTLAEPVQLLE